MPLARDGAQVPPAVTQRQDRQQRTLEVVCLSDRHCTVSGLFRVCPYSLLSLRVVCTIESQRKVDQSRLSEQGLIGGSLGIKSMLKPGH